jgi:hypothetical protein
MLWRPRQIIDAVRTLGQRYGAVRRRIDRHRPGWWRDFRCRGETVRCKPGNRDRRCEVNLDDNRRRHTVRTIVNEGCVEGNRRRGTWRVIVDRRGGGQSSTRCVKGSCPQETWRQFSTGDVEAIVDGRRGGQSSTEKVTEAIVEENTKSNRRRQTGEREPHLTGRVAAAASSRPATVSGW